MCDVCCVLKQTLKKHLTVWKSDSLASSGVVVDQTIFLLLIFYHFSAHMEFPSDIKDRVWDTLSAIHRCVEDSHNPASPRVWFIPKDAQTIQRWGPSEKNTYLHFCEHMKMPEEELVAIRAVTHIAVDTCVIPVNYSPRPDDLKYLYADFCSVISHLLAKHLRKNGFRVEIKAKRFVPNEKYELVLLQNDGGSKPLHLSRYDSRFGYFIAHSVVIVNDVTCIDVLASTLANSGYNGFEQWPCTQQHEHTGGTGRYVNYMKSEDDLVSRKQSVVEFLELSGNYDKHVWTAALVDEIIKVWSRV